MNKTKIVRVISVCILLLTIILNIVLLSTKVFKGKEYVCKEESVWRYCFYQNTYYLGREYNNKIVFWKNGFYTYESAKEIKKNHQNSNIKHDQVWVSDGSSTGVKPLYRCSVFKFMDKDQPTADTKYYYCGFAIFLQVLYIIIMLASISTIIILNIKEKNIVWK